MNRIKKFEAFNHRIPQTVGDVEYQNKLDTHGKEPYTQKELDFFEKLKKENTMSLYEFGTICGTVILGILSDKNEGAKRSPTAMSSILISLFISFTFVIFYDNYPTTLWFISMFFYGFFLGSIHHMICVTVAADLGRSHSKSATSTITGIIDGIGSSGNGAG
jgi:sugar phosphate permease